MKCRYMNISWKKLNRKFDVNGWSIVNYWIERENNLIDWKIKWKCILILYCWFNMLSLKVLMGVNFKVKVKWIILYGFWCFGVDDKIGCVRSECICYFIWCIYVVEKYVWMYINFK